MPIYVYQCHKCNYRFEIRQTMNAAPPRCPECEGKVRRIIQPNALHFKGPGFFTTDNKGDTRVRSESGALGQKVSETDVSDLTKGIRTNSKGYPKATPTTPTRPGSPLA